MYCRTRNVEAFLEKTAIAYRQNVAFFLEFGWYAIAVFSKNATTLRVLVLACSCKKSETTTGRLPVIGWKERKSATNA